MCGPTAIDLIQGGLSNISLFMEVMSPPRSNLNIDELTSKRTSDALTLVSGDIWFIPEFGCVLDELDVHPGLWTSVWKKIIHFFF